MKVAVIGTGYVGLVTGTCFAEAGNDVICIDNNPDKLTKLHAGIVPIYEPGLEALFHRNVKEGRLRFSGDLKEAVDYAEIIFLALPTPPMEDGSADLKYVLGVAENIGKIITDYRVLINKSTVPVGTGDLVEAAVRKNTSVDFDVISNPEFLREGFAVEDFMKPERVVIGSSSERANDFMRRLYKPFTMSGNPLIFMDRRSAEVTKYAANSFLAAKISFMNEVANLCELVGADVDNVRKGIGSDSRIGKRFLFSGVGYGGSCFPKDVSALHKTSQQYGYDFKILDAVMQVNNQQKEVLVEKIISHYGANLTGKTLAIWGLAFKPNTDDIREAPALIIIDLLIKAGATIRAYDPEAMKAVQTYYPDLVIDYCQSQYEALQGADALVIVTEWNEFRTPDFNKLRTFLNAPVIFDGRNIYEVDDIAKEGFSYYSIGRKTVTV